MLHLGQVTGHAVLLRHDGLVGRQGGGSEIRIVKMGDVLFSLPTHDTREGQGRMTLGDKIRGLRQGLSTCTPVLWPGGLLAVLATCESRVAPAQNVTRLLTSLPLPWSTIGTKAISACPSLMRSIMNKRRPHN